MKLDIRTLSASLVAGFVSWYLCAGIYNKNADSMWTPLLMALLFLVLAAITCLVVRLTTGRRTRFMQFKGIGQIMTMLAVGLVALMVLAGKINKTLVNLIELKGGSAIGLSGLDGHMLKATVKKPELGYVGEITDVNVQPILDVIDKGYIPVVSTVGYDDAGNIYNINADTAAAEIAIALHAEKLVSMTDIVGLLYDKNDESTLIPGAESLIAMTDIAGILQNKDDPSTLLPAIRIDELPELVSSGVIQGGMIPKAECCRNAIEWGVRRVFIIDGRVPHAILIEMLTNEGIGTMFTR